ncbi:hypothetical protein GTH52_07080 [Clostridium tyrobutyricum]|uniref:Conserved protein n=1 Tax=Clostridium tyrobutyricum DIVETGP TaxID=1408889 RepID=W6N5C6_CLOTY|nr:hypothetical protein [Clostridium tyrobutyricum]AND84269.1 hypothetical protein CTK_C10080 [Clostridium tyrobutyricum]AND84353.1 hypothetical protein CTK_C10920 [Clostridium tyrobutyricum]ANP68984.1 hypothetical protein BA182_04640 [Clostridium tyrobutyricum]MBV4432414.1 hypothetical protein [Clostridium tyrobutyricum]MBV4435411.1 hypothetical protein [Clostridium tyrobutyricum]
MRWDETKKQRIRRQLVRKVAPFMKDIIILRKGENIFGEYEEDQYVCTVKGYYHKGGTYITNFINDGANLNRNYEDRLLFILDDEVKKIKEHDYFKLDDVIYEIIDKGNIEDIVWDTYLKRKE